MTDSVTSQNIDLSSWDILYIGLLCHDAIFFFWQAATNV